MVSVVGLKRSLLDVLLKTQNVQIGIYFAKCMAVVHLILPIFCQKISLTTLFAKNTTYIKKVRYDRV
jgi:hypothetical protein